MRGPEWLAACLLYPLSVLVARTWEIRLHPKQESLVKHLSYEIVTPIRVNEFGETFPHTQHFKRRKRTTETVLMPIPYRTHYRVSAYGQVFQLNLSADASFVAPHYTEVHMGATKEDLHSDLLHCFYRGHVNAQEIHTAVFSICGGLMGTFKSHDGEYFLEPLMTANEDAYEDAHSKSHLIYRHEEFKIGSYQNSYKPCEISGETKESTLVLTNENINQDINVLQESMVLEYASENPSAKNESNSHFRKKRFLSYPRFVEVMVTVDPRMAQHHGQNLQHYVLTLISIVAAIYKDPSIGNQINIIIVKLIVVHNEQDGPAISFNAATTLRNFCLWQQTQNILDDTHPSHHDTAVLITREDICRAREKCDTLGLAELGTICDLRRSCSISEENGLSSAFTIAHELGHVFNVPHDDSFKCKEAGMKHQYHVMAPTLNYHSSPWTWSKCSQKYITEFLDAGYGECLLDKPTGRVYELQSQLPGSMYGVNKQCELMFGSGSQVCPYMKQCKRLWCTSTEGIHKGCRTQHMPLADGTECGRGMHCQHGICVNKEMGRFPVDGAWGSWGPYGSCTRTCGGGIKSTTRLCNRPEPKHGGQYCVGRRMKFRSCSTDACPKNKQDFREKQCSEFDGKHFSINGLTSAVRWLPKYNGISVKDRCKLFCRVSGTTSYYQLKDRVVDGTPCGTDTHDICVQGLCRQAGCDHVLNSKARRDKCGVCGGDNSLCRTLSGTFNSAHYGYNIIVKIPIGATNLDIRQHSYSGKPEDDNYLGNFFLNGNFVVSLSKKEISIHGASFEYSGSNNTVEQINSTGQLEEEILLQVLCVGNLYNPDVRYSFNILVEEESNLFTWDPHGLWQDCPKMCQGFRKRKITCTRKSDYLVVSDQECEHITLPPAVMEQCNTDCELRWRITGKSECSSRCGPGVRSLDIHCMKYSTSKGLSVPVADTHCADQRKPPLREPCRGDCVLNSWHYTGWSECSRSCGQGERSREAFCMDKFGHRLADRECHELAKIVTENCNEFLCPIWTASDWSECPVTCGKGMRHRHVWCQLNDDQLEDVFCNPDSIPESVSPCELNECAAWQVGPWGACSVTCGHGYQVRAVKCVAGATILDDDRECSAATRPKDSQECEMPSCPETTTMLWPTSLPVFQTDKITQWRFGSWTPVSIIAKQCSASCGRGTQARYVSCRDSLGRIVEESYCAHIPRPEELASCFSPCGVWQAGSWSTCTVTCGNGIVTRQVVCVNHHQQIDENYCDPEGRPAHEQECNRLPCQPAYRRILDIHEHPSHSVDQNYPPIHTVHRSQDSVNHPSPGRHQWRTGPWGACSSTCAGGFHRRVVVCQDEEGRNANYCDEATKPPDSRHCDSGPCPRWNYGNWGECAQTCGNGIKTRLVICQLPNGQVLNDQNCEMLEKPPDTAECNILSCAGEISWQRGPWKSCSVSCGKGLKYRDVYCVNNFQTKLGEDACKHLKRPQTYKVCRAARCPEWKTNRWKECSVTCGAGIQHRDVYCRQRGSGRLDEQLCSHLTQPPSKRPCFLSACRQYWWLTEEWQDCSSCRKKKSHRKVKCVDKNRTEVNESFCHTIKPPSTKKCSMAPCNYIVITVDSSQCPAGCYLPDQQKITYCGGVYDAWNNEAYGLQSVAYRECPLVPSPLVNGCNVRACLHGATWKAGKWSKCSVLCGMGTKQRIIECLTENGSYSNLCLSHLKPATQRTCHAKVCETITSCKEIQIRQKIRQDGDYLLNVKGRMIKIYCSDMWLKNPKEYLTLVKGEDNFSEVYGYRLQNPYECPFNGSRRQDCMCRNDYPAVGYTIFRKIKIDLSSLEIETTNFRFAHTILGKPVPFATAGDCYSAARCPQGQFGINLAGTGLRLATTAKWVAQGNYATVQIHKSQDDTKIYGRCGGFCGKCLPNSSTGLQLEMQ